MTIHVPVSIGELYDKISILKIKAKNMKGAALAHVEDELGKLQGIRDSMPHPAPAKRKIDECIYLLDVVNRRLWNIEDEIRSYENKKSFNSKFIKLARSVYQENDMRSEIKNKLNKIYDSDIVEEKFYK